MGAYQPHGMVSLVATMSMDGGPLATSETVIVLIISIALIMRINGGSLAPCYGFSDEY